jgi:hypothetical protein
MQTVDVAPFVDKAPIPDFTNLVNAVGELKTPILDVDESIAIGLICSVYVNYARHATPRPQLGSAAPLRKTRTPINTRAYE